MNSYSDVDGVPAGADPWLLTELLRDQWEFTGTVVSDYWAVPFLATMHRVAADTDEAGALALAAGIDVELPDTGGFGAGLVERVRRGDVAEALVDRAARRILTQKVAARPAGPGLDARGLGGRRGRHRPRLRRRTAPSPARWPSGRSCCSTPARRCRCSASGRAAPRRVAVVGPCADDPRTFMGCYAFPNHVLPRHPHLGLGIEVQTVVEALRAELPDAEVLHEQGCPVQGDDRSGFAAALAAARDADLCVAVVGDRAGLFGQGTSGEGCDAEDLRLPGVQADLVDELAGRRYPGGRRGRLRPPVRAG